MEQKQKQILSITSQKFIPVSEIKTAAHDLNNLINNIINGISLISESIEANPKSYKIIESIKENSRLASNILFQLTSPIHKRNNCKSTVSLNGIINSVLSSFDNHIKENVKIDFTGTIKEDTVWGNSTELKRVLINLILNAKEASGKNGKISISLNSDIINGSEFLIITVNDNGKGIPQEYINKIFDEGFSLKDKSTSQGLGLAIVKNIVESHSGSIEVKSEINSGTTFKIILPRKTSKRDIKKLRNKTVLLAEDDSFQREVLKDLLVSLNINVLTATNGFEALEKIEQVNIDLLIIDKIMPVMDGMECISEIRKSDYFFPIVLTSGSDIEECTELNISRILKKPYNFEMIQATLLELLT